VSTGLGFGRTLAVGDFDGDGFDDLAATWLPAGLADAARVRVFWGQAGPVPLSATFVDIDGADVYPFGAPEVEDTEYVKARLTFGFSTLASSRSIATRWPSACQELGAVCQLLFEPSKVMASDCFDNPLWHDDEAASGSRSRSAMCIRSTCRYPLSHAAKLAEVVVGAPGYRGTGTVLAFSTVIDDGIPQAPKINNGVDGARMGQRHYVQVGGTLPSDVTAGRPSLRI
jgi:hypothetical protein